MRDQNMDKARALYYGMFSRLFTLSSDYKRYYELISIVETLKENSLDSLSAEAFENLYAKLPSKSNSDLIHEFDTIFYAPQNKTIKTTASFYIEGIESGKKRLEMQNFLAKTKIRRDEDKFSDAEDHIGFIFTVMAELSELSANGEEAYENTAHCIFEQILNEFVDEFNQDLFEHKDADIFKNVAVLLKSFIAFERLYLEVSLPEVKHYTPAVENVEESISEEERARRERNKALRAKGPKKEEACDLFTASSAEEEI